MKAATILSLAGLLLWGCASESSTRPAPRDRALSDPMNYRPGWEDTDISGGGLLNYDSKGMKRDLDGVFNP